jgi:hypothetical protein
VLLNQSINLSSPVIQRSWYAKKKSKRDDGETSLDGTGSNHLLLQVLLVLADAAVPAGDGLVLAHHDVLGDLVEESGKVIC